MMMPYSFHGDVILTGEDKDSRSSWEGAQQETKSGNVFSSGVEDSTREDCVDNTIGHNREEYPEREY